VKFTRVDINVFVGLTDCFIQYPIELITEIVGVQRHEETPMADYSLASVEFGVRSTLFALPRSRDCSCPNLAFWVTNFGPAPSADAIFSASAFDVLDADI
jgi:hypothetical protein